MIRIIRKQFTQIATPAGGDHVLALMPIAPRGVFFGIRGEVHMVAQDVPKIQAMMFPCRVYAAQMTEIDDLVDNWQDLWDRYVPKDDDVSEVAATYQIDMARDTEDTAPFEEPGEPSPNELFGVREPTTIIWKRDKLISIATSPVGYEGAAVDTYVATDRYNLNVRRRIVFPQGGFVAMGVASPNWDDVTASVPLGSANISDVMMYGNMPDFLHTARLALIGATEAGAESPFVDVLSLIETLTEPTVYEENAGAYVATDARFFSRIVFDVGVPENADTKVLKSD